MNLAETELTIGGVKLKGIYIVLVVSLATTLGSFVWTASSLYSRLEKVEAVVIPDIVPLEEKILLIEQELVANDVSKLQGKLAELGTNLVVIKDQQTGLLTIQSQVTSLEKDIETMRSTVKQAELIVDDMSELKTSIDKLDIEANDLWQAVEYLSNPLK
jgi:tetrahydromethanopterin S-methyltransferase subunit B